MAKAISYAQKREIIQERQKMILRDMLAVDRTKMANQRTLMAFFRMGLYLWVTALAVMKVDILEGLFYFGPVFIAVGLVIMIIGFTNYNKMRKKIFRAYTEV